MYLTSGNGHVIKEQQTRNVYGLDLVYWWATCITINTAYSVLLSRAKLVRGGLHVLEAFICLDTLHLNDCVISRLMLRQRAIFVLSPAEQNSFRATNITLFVALNEPQIFKMKKRLCTI